MSNQSILGIIPARSGSKGIPDKNIKSIYGKPLIAWTIEQSQRSELLTRTIVSTDSDKIISVAKEFDADIPFIRPTDYAQDTSPTSDAVIHALDALRQQGESYDYVALLEPTSPLRNPYDIDQAIELLLQTPEADALISLGEVHTEHPLIVKRVIDGMLEPYMKIDKAIWQRQQADAAYFPYGIIYIVKVKQFYEEKTFYLPNAISYTIERWQNYEIDDEIDFLITEVLLEKFADKMKG